MKSSLEMPDWVQIVRNVEALMNEWFGMVRGVPVPSGFSRNIEMCSFSRTTRNPRDSKALTTRRLEHRLGIWALDFNSRLGDGCLQDWRINLQDFLAECFDVEADCGSCIIQRLLVRIPLADDNPLEAERIRHESVWMFLHYEQELSHGISMIDTRAAVSQLRDVPPPDSSRPAGCYRTSFFHRWRMIVRRRVMIAPVGSSPLGHAS